MFVSDYMATLIYSMLLMTIMTYSAKLITHQSGCMSAAEAHNEAVRPIIDP